MKMMHERRRDYTLYNHDTPMSSRRVLESPCLEEDSDTIIFWAKPPNSMPITISATMPLLSDFGL